MDDLPKAHMQQLVPVVTGERRGEGVYEEIFISLEYENGRRNLID
jgi:hypothetical protein